MHVRLAATHEIYSDFEALENSEATRLGKEAE